MQRESSGHADTPAAVDPIDGLERTLLAYIAGRPGACDTLHGICEWWIPTRLPRLSQAQVLAALKRLEIRGAIVSRIGIDGQARYAAPDVDPDSQSRPS